MQPHDMKQAIIIHREKSLIRWVGVILDEYVMVQTYAIKRTNAVLFFFLSSNHPLLAVFWATLTQPPLLEEANMQNSKQHDFMFCGSIKHYNHPSLSRNRTVEFNFAHDTGYKAPADARMALEPKMEEVKAGERENGLLLPTDRRCFLVWFLYTLKLWIHQIWW